MKELELINGEKSTALKISGEQRKESIAKSAHYQSKMIEQRKQKEGAEVIEDADEQKQTPVEVSEIPTR